MVVTLGRVIQGAKSDAILGTADRTKIIDYINRAIELYADRANWDIFLGTLDVCSDGCGFVTLPGFVETVIQVNVGGSPTLLRSEWYQFHLNGGGSCGCGPVCGFSQDEGTSPTFQDLKQWSMVAAICEDPIDGNGTLEMIVEGETQDPLANCKDALTIPLSGPSMPGVRIPLKTNWAATDKQFTWFKRITRVTKPPTRGYVKLIGIVPQQMANAVTLGYYAPGETNPLYRRIRVGCKCGWVRIRYRRVQAPLAFDYEQVPIASYQAMLDLLKAVRLSDANNVELSEAYIGKAMRLLTEIQDRDATWSPIQFERGWGVGTVDYR